MEITSSEISCAVAVAFVVFGLVSLFFGFRLFRIIAGCLGFIVSGVVAYVMVYYFIAPSFLASIIVGSTVGALGGVLFSYFFAAGLFLSGSFVGFCFSLFLISLIQDDYMNEDGSRDFVVLALSMVGGLLAIRFRKPAVIACTSLVGGYGIVAGLDNWIASGYNELHNAILDRALTTTTFSSVLVGLLIVWAFVVAVGVIVQVKLTAKNIELESTTGGMTVPSFFGKKAPRQDDSVPLLEVITYIESEDF